MIYHCCDPRRRELVLTAIEGGADINGIDALEVLDTEAPASVPRQRTLLLRFLAPAPDLTTAEIEIAGGERVTGIDVLWVTRADAPQTPPAEDALADWLLTLPEPENVLALRTSSSGDFSTYTLRLAGSDIAPPDGIDRVLSVIDFSFKVECPSDFDCAPVCHCDEEDVPVPPLSYLAKDYTSFRRLMLSRMAQLAPEWRERNPADLGITLVEALAYTADRLSYAQDAAATEAYLATARRRSSVRRHARLVDYHVDDGANARVFVHVTAEDGSVDIAEGEQFLTRVTDIPAVISEAGDLRRAFAAYPQFFEALEPFRAFPDQNEIWFYEWGGTACCLPAGATRATLEGHVDSLAEGRVLIFEEVLGPRTGRAADADPEKRHAVMLTRVLSGIVDDLTGTEITEIRWAEEDALPFPLCISSELDAAHGGGVEPRISRAVGNVLLAAHGRRIESEELGVVPAPHLFLVPDGAATCDPCERTDPEPVPPRFRPLLAEGPVAQHVPPDGTAPAPVSAFAKLRAPGAERRPWLDVTGGEGAEARSWEARRDLLGSDRDAPHFVLEVESDGRAHLRFGDGTNGQRPVAATPFTATYRVGNGPVGNVGRDAIRHLERLEPPEFEDPQGTITEIRNPMPAIGGTAPETVEAVRQAAPFAYRRQERAVTPEDYARIALRFPDVQRARATFRFNGHGYTVFVTVDRFGGRPITDAFETELTQFLDRFRMAGYDLEIDAPIFVPLDIALFICAEPDHFASEVRRAVLAELSAGPLPNDQRGFFHPDNLTFAEPVYLSALYARIMAVPGVASVRATRFHRRERPDTIPLRDGLLTFERLEIAQLENDPSFPERGALEITMGGGK